MSTATEPDLPSPDGLAFAGTDRRPGPVLRRHRGPEAAALVALSLGGELGPPAVPKPAALAAPSWSRSGVVAGAGRHPADRDDRARPPARLASTPPGPRR